MKLTIARRRYFAVALIAALWTVAGSQAAFAIVPEVQKDQRSGQFVTHFDLGAALVGLEAPDWRAEVQWTRAPWFGS